MCACSGGGTGSRPDTDAITAGATVRLGADCAVWGAKGVRPKVRVGSRMKAGSEITATVIWGTAWKADLHKPYWG